MAQEQTATVQSVSLRKCSWCGKEFFFDKLQGDITDTPLESSFYDITGELEGVEPKSLRDSIIRGRWMGQDQNEKMKFIRRLKHIANSIPPVSSTTDTQEQHFEICHVCLRIVEDEVDRETDQLYSENESYKQALQSHDDTESFSDADPSHLSEQELDCETQRLQSEISQLEHVGKELHAEKLSLANEYLKLLDTEDEYVKMMNQLDREYIEAERLLDAFAVHIRNMESSLVFTNKIRPYQIAFAIDTAGTFATINGFPIAFPPSNDASFTWKHVNEGLGQTALLLSILVQMAKVIRVQDPSVLAEFNSKRRTCRVLFKGPRSVIEALESQSPQRYPLYTDSDPTTSIFGRIWGASKTDFDKGLQKLLYLISVVCSLVKHVSGNACPYQMSDEFLIDKNGEKFSITVSSSPPDKWTQACKMMLSNLKYLLCWFEEVYCSDNQVQDY